MGECCLSMYPLTAIFLLSLGLSSSSYIPSYPDCSSIKTTACRLEHLVPAPENPSCMVCPLLKAENEDKINEDSDEGGADYKWDDWDFKFYLGDFCCDGPNRWFTSKY